MNKKTVNLVSSIVLLLSFFMPWINFFGYSGSAFEVPKQVFKNLKYVEKEPAILFGLLLLIFPICAIIVIRYYVQQKIEEKNVTTINIAKKTPLIFFIVVVIYGLVKVGDGLKMLKEIDITEIIGIGFFLTIISAAILFFDKTIPMDFTNKNTARSIPKEEADTEDLFN